MKSINIQKGYDLPLSFGPTEDLIQLATPQKVAALPNRIPFIKPKLLVKEGQSVKIGSVLFEDKRHPEVKFLAPGAGTIQGIVFGKRRIIKEIVIDLDPQEDQESFAAYRDTDVINMDRVALTRAIMERGCWPFLRALPFGDMPEPQSEPPAIIVHLDSKEPFSPSPDVIYNQCTATLEFGLTILRQLSKNVLVTMAGGMPQTRSQLNGFLTHIMNGPYPAGDPGVLLYHIKKQPDQNRSWTIAGQNLLLLAQTMQSGHYAIDRTVVVAGSHARHQRHVSTRIGAPLEHIAGEPTSVSGGSRYVTGGLFNGYESQKESYIGLFETALIVIPQGDQKELFGFARPGFSKPSHSRAFLSTFNKAPLMMDCGMHGEVRACINCGYCTQVCAVDILPQFTLKCVLAGELEEALAHGLLDCVECGLCTYVCPSKIEISTRLSQAKQDYYKEIS